MKKFKIRLLLLFFGGVSFWAPLKVLELVTVNIVTGTLVPPLTFLMAYFTAKKRGMGSVRAISVWMLIGVYLLGPWIIMAGATALGAGFTQFHGWEDWRWMFLSMFFPPATLIMTVYDFSALGLLGTTVMAVFLHRRFELHMHEATTG